MECPAKITISHPQYSDGRKRISLEVYDADAGITFLNLEISYENFTEALTGLSRVPCMMDIQRLANVGKKIERKTFDVLLPDSEVGRYCRKEIAREIALKECPEGWEISGRFTSHDSFWKDVDGNLYARCNIVRWVEKEESECTE